MIQLRVAIVCDYIEEQWPSMQLVAAMLLDHLSREHRGQIDAVAVQPRFVRRLSRCRAASASMLNGDRFLNRFVDYPRLLRSLHHDFDAFHIVDHSYSHLVRALPPGRTIVTCHDLDTFRCLFEPSLEPRSRLFRTMVRRILLGLRSAARICTVTETTRQTLLRDPLMSPDSLVTIPNGVHPACSPLADEEKDRAIRTMLGSPSEGAIDLLHVGSSIARKRLDLLFRMFAELRRNFPGARLLRVGGCLTRAQAELVKQLGIASSIIELPFLDAPTLAALYRRATLLLMPSDAEGFGLPAIEAMACGTPVLLSDLLTLREVAGDAAEYASPGSLAAWVSAASSMLEGCINAPARWASKRAAGIQRSRVFSWSQTAASFTRLYNELGCSVMRRL
jgi:glycosyltransferase involved in cell wall biosynthesis